MGLRTAAQNVVRMCAKTRANMTCGPKAVCGCRINTAETQEGSPTCSSPNELFLRVKRENMSIAPQTIICGKE
jgi:hypothetical protein